jgi:predicted acyl esterase
MFAYNSCPPDPELAGERWSEMWLERLEGSGLWLEKWLRHQRRDAYWRHGSICEDFSAVKCPVFAVSGWADGYSNAVFRLMENLQVPRKGLIGPWSHKYPHLGVPGPAIGFLQEAVRWFDHWLKGVDTGIMAEPMLRVWMQDSVPPTTSYIERPGRWVAEPSWPSGNIEERRYPLAPNRIEMSSGPVEDTELTVQSPLTVGLFAGKWCSYAAGPDLAHDQREEDGGALVFDSEPLTDDVEIMGAAIVDLEIAADKPVAMVAVRLSDVAEDDKATRVTYGLLNLTHRDSSEHPEPLEPGRFCRVRVGLNHVAHAFPRGHRFRLSVSSSYWPLAWPPPEAARLRIRTGSSTLSLPVRPRRESDNALRRFGEPEGSMPPGKAVIEPEHHNWRVIRDLTTDESTLEVINDGGVYRIEDLGLEIKSTGCEWYSSVADDFGSVRGETSWTRLFRRGDWQVETRTRTVLTSTVDHFHIYADLDAFEGDKRVFSRSWERIIKRDLV